MDANSSWKSGEQKIISSILTVVEEDIPSEDDHKIFELLDEDKCISLKRPENNIDCSIFFFASCNVSLVSEKKIIDPDVKLITNIILVSEAKNVEAFTGPFQEYYKTFQSSLISDLGDNKIFKTLVTFPKPEKSVMLKLKGFPCNDDIWIYGIFIKLQSVRDSFDKNIANKLDCILEDKQVVLSENAKHFKALYSTMNYSQNKCDKSDYKQFLINIGNNFNSLQIDTDVDSENSSKLKANFGKERTVNSYFDKMLNPDLMTSTSNIQNPTLPTSFLIPNFRHIIPADPNESVTHCKCCKYKERENLPTNLNLHNSINYTISSTQPKLKELFQPSTNLVGVEETVGLQFEESVSHILEPLLNLKLKEFEMKLKVQFEERNASIMNKLSNIETLLMEVIKNKQ